MMCTRRTDYANTRRPVGVCANTAQPDSKPYAEKRYMINGRLPAAGSIGPKPESRYPARMDGR